MIGDVPVRNMIVTSSFSYAYVTAAPLHSLWEGEGVCKFAARYAILFFASFTC